MRNAAYIVIAMVVILAGFFAYTEYRLNEFEKSLPKPPIEQAKKVETKSEKLPERVVIQHKQVEQASKQSHSEEDHYAPTTQRIHDESEIIKSAKEQQSRQAANNNLTGSLKLDPTEPEPEPHFSEISVEAFIERNRKALIAKHGNIPEIEVFLKYFPFRTAQNAEDGDEVVMTAEENLEYVKAISVLFPSQENKERYQEVLRDIQEGEKVH